MLREKEINNNCVYLLRRGKGKLLTMRIVGEYFPIGLLARGEGGNFFIFHKNGVNGWMNIKKETFLRSIHTI
jgi:hypothetical protein